METRNPAAEPWQRTATDLADAIRRREVSSVEVVRSCLARIEQTNPRLAALVDIRPEEALADARRADRDVAAGVELGPLHGVPVSTKINTDQRGRVTSHGVAALAGRPAEGDAACVTALREAGAVLLGRSNAPAFSYRWFSTNALHGRTLNPWDATRTPGGSSGGASSSLAAGMTPIAQGNDIGGSIRYPAACCGVVGIRPTVGRVSGWTPPAYADTPAGRRQIDVPPTVQACAVEGPLARSVADARLALHVMTTPDLRDPYGIPAAPVRLPEGVKAKVTVVRGIGTVKNHPAVDRAVTEAAAQLAEAGHEVEELDDLPLLAEAARIWALLIYEDFRPMLPLVNDVGDDDIRTSLRYSFGAAAAIWGERPSLETYIQGWARRASLITRLQQLLGNHRVLLTPVCAEPAFEQDADIASPERAAELVAAMWPMAAVPVLGFPAVTVPSSLSDGLPVSVQLIGGRYAEERILDAARAIEDRTPRFLPPLGTG
ncbi:amidase [Streptomyces longisporoflavus]|uniref:amidase n=1 Tax=Streptomyces longisporoflavus TaxID=28044 RepID=UPI00167D8EF9|nr:amidase [Streptomyces longisporoflavus]GGV40249.1 amidase [Streptomyces longisporoflavus]